MEKTLTQLTPIPVEFVVGHAQAKNTESQRKPYVELIRSWASHEGMDDEGLRAIRRITGQQQIDAQHMPKEFYQLYRSGEKAERVIAIVQKINDQIQSGEVMWTWAHVMRVMIDENILLSSVSINRYDAIICALIPGKGRDTVRKNGDYSIMDDRDDSYRLWPSNTNINPVKASAREICEQIVQLFAPVLSRQLHTSI